MTDHAYVIGSGAIGTFLAERLAKHTPTSLVVRDESQSAPDGGVELRGAIEDPLHPIPIKRWKEITRFEPGSLILVTSKVFDLPGLLASLRPRLSGSETLVLCQNGLGVSDLAHSALPEVKSWGRAVCWFGVRIDHQAAERRSILHVAGIDAMEFAFTESSVVQRFTHLITLAGIPPRPVSTIEQVEWRKALWNISSNGLCALAEAPNGEAAQNDLLRPLAEQLFNEAAAVANARGVELGTEVREMCFAGMIRTATNLNSTLMDLRAGRTTEMNWLNGAVVRWSDELGLPCPANRMVTNLIRYLEKTKTRKASR